MIKRTVLIFMAFMLCGVPSSAQNVDADTYKKLLEYCCCKYAEEYLDLYCKNFPKYPNAKQYKNVIKPKLSDCTIANHPSFDELLIIVKNTPAKGLVSGYRDNRQNKTSLNDLYLDKYGSNYKVDFVDLNYTLKTEITNYLNNESSGDKDKNVGEQVEEDLEGDSLSNEIDIFQNRIESIKFHDDTLTLSSGKSLILGYVILFPPNQKLDLEVISSDTTVVSAVLNEQGDIWVTAKKAKWEKDIKEKMATVTAKISGTNKKASCTIIVTKRNDIKIFLFTLAIIGLLACAIVRWKLWDKIKEGKMKTLTAPIVNYFVNYSNKRPEKDNTSTVQVKKPEKPEKPEKTDYVREYEKLKDEFHALDKDYERLKKSNSVLLSERNEWEKKYKELKKQVEKTHGNAESSKQNTDNQNISKPVAPVTVLYADAIVDDFFNEVKEMPDEDAIFELDLHNPYTASFTIYHSAKQKILANPSVLNGCNKQVLNNAQNVKIESEGKAQLQANDKWKVLQKLNVTIC